MKDRNGLKNKPHRTQENAEEQSDANSTTLSMGTINVCTLAMRKDPNRKEQDGDIANLPEWLMIFNDMRLDIVEKC